jgi:hypothetical protein
MRIRLEGAFWPVVDVIEFTDSGALVETPTEPELQVGAVADIAVDGLHGYVVVETAHGSVTSGSPRAYYSIRIVESDKGLIAALISSARRRRAAPVRIFERKFPPFDELSDDDLVGAVGCALQLCDALTLPAETIELIMERQLHADRMRARQRLDDLVGSTKLIRLVEPDGAVRYGLPL